MELEAAARNGAITKERVRQVLDFCRTRRKIAVSSIAPVENGLDRGETIGYELVLHGGRKMNHLKVSLAVFRLATLCVSRNAWEHSLNPEGRLLLENIIGVGRTVVSINGPRTIFDLAAERATPPINSNSSSR